MTYGSEAWHLTADVASALNGANSQMVNVITDNTPQSGGVGEVEDLRPGVLDQSETPAVARAHPAAGCRKEAEASCVRNV